MSPPKTKSVTIDVEHAGSVSGLFVQPAQSRFGYVFAHGAGAGMNHSFLQAVADELAARGVATLRYQFPYMEAGGKRPDAPKVAHAAVRSAIAAMRRLAPELPLVAGGKSFGGRMTSQAQAIAPLDGVKGLVFLGFPLHPAKKPSRDRADHLRDIKIPMLFFQGTRDALAELDEITPVVASLGSRATIFLVPDADHSFHVPAKTGKTDGEVRSIMLDVLAEWGKGMT